MVDIGGSIGSVIGSQGGKLAGKAGAAVAGATGSALAGQVATGLAAKGLAIANSLLSGRQDPDTAFSFYVEINGIQTVKFTECNGIEWKASTESFYCGGINDHKINLIGPGSFKPLVLKKGFHANNSEFYEWMRAQYTPGSPASRTNVAIVITDDARSGDVGRFLLHKAFISRYKGPSLNAKQDAIAFEEIEITYATFEFVPGDLLGALLNMGASYGLSML